MLIEMPRRKKGPKIRINIPIELRDIAMILVGMSAGLIVFFYSRQEIAHVQTHTPSLQVCFSPEGKCENSVINALSKAKDSIRVQTYSFTSSRIAEALIMAKGRGVDVTILCDKSQLTAPYSQIPNLADRGIPVFVDRVSGIAHNKVIIIDDQYVLTGSYNWTKAANSRNSENLLLVDSKELAADYIKNWKKRFASSYSAIVNEANSSTKQKVEKAQNKK